MCCEDLKIAESMWSEGRLVNLAIGDNLLLSPSATRVAIVIGQQSSGALRISLDNDDPAAGGFVQSPTLPLMMFDIWTHGNMVRKAWRCNSSVVTNIYITETHLSPDNPCNGK